MKNINNIISI